MKKVLIITYYWPPAGGSGVQRWLKFVKYLRNYGYEPVVYTPLNPEFMATDPGLLAEVPQGVTVIKRKIIEPYSMYKLITGKKGQNIKPGFIAERFHKNDLAIFYNSNSQTYRLCLSHNLLQFFYCLLFFFGFSRGNRWNRDNNAC